MALMAPDWFRIITDLIYAGMSMSEIGRAVDAQMSKQLLNNYRAGGQPTYVRGEALVRMWCETIGRTADQIPRAPYTRGHRVERRRLAGRNPRPSV